METSGQAEASEAAPLPGPARRFVELFALSGFVIAAPILQMFGKNAEVFAFRHASGRDVVLFALIMITFPPTFFWAIEQLLSLVGRTAVRACHDAVLGGLWILLGIQILKHFDVLPDFVILFGGVLVGVVMITLTVARSEVRLWLVYASPAPVVFAALFLFSSAASDAVFANESVAAARLSVSKPSPVILVVLDEFSLASLLDNRGHIDAGLFPSFAALERTTTAHLAASSNSYATTYALPAILTGNFPHTERLPLASSYPRNLFTLLGGTYNMNVQELLPLCPSSECPQDRAFLDHPGLAGLSVDAGLAWTDLINPGIKHTDPTGALFGDAIQGMQRVNGFTDAGEGVSRSRAAEVVAVPDRFASFVDGIEKTAQPSLNFLHVLLPHAPWAFLPDGHQYGDPPLLGLENDAWDEQGRPEILARQRYLLQVQYVDRLIGQLVADLKAAGLWERATFVLTADHGVSTTPGQPRRDLTPGNAAEIGWVPLFVKEPGQREGGPIRDNAQSIDIVPTIADALGVTIPWHVDGRSLLSAEGRAGRARTDYIQGGTVYTLDEARAQEAIEAKSTGAFAHGRGDPLRLYRVGAGADLVGSEVGQLRIGLRASGVATVESSGSWAHVDLDALAIPAYLSGHLQGGPGTVLVSVNGRVAFVSETFRAGGNDAEFAGLIPPSFLREGHNDVGLYLLQGEGSATTLHAVSADVG